VQATEAPLLARSGVGPSMADDVRDWTAIGVIVCAASALMWTLLLV
jgi:hypothetical protein